MEFLGIFRKNRTCNTYKKHFCFAKGFYAQFPCTVFTENSWNHLNIWQLYVGSYRSNFGASWQPWSDINLFLSILWCIKKYAYFLLHILTSFWNVLSNSVDMVKFLRCWHQWRRCSWSHWAWRSWWPAQWRTWVKLTTCFHEFSEYDSTNICSGIIWNI